MHSERPHADLTKPKKVLISKILKSIFHKWQCTDQVIGSDDVAASDNIGVLNGTPG